MLLTFDRGLTLRVPTSRELPGVLIRPFLRHVVRCVGGPGGEVHQERLVGCEGLLLAHPGDGAIGEVFQFWPTTQKSTKARGT